MASTSEKGGGRWSDLSDIVELNHFDPGWNEEVQSEIKNEIPISANENMPSTDKRQRSKRKRKERTDIERMKQKEYQKRYLEKIRSDPQKKEVYRAQRKQWNADWKLKKLSKMTESEKKALEARIGKKRSIYDQKMKAKYGGFATAKSQRLNTIRRLKFEGKASEEDLKYLHDYQEREKIIRRKQRAAKKQK